MEQRNSQDAFSSRCIAAQHAGFVLAKRHIARINRRAANAIQSPPGKER
jgi:hypothetical protein